MSLKNHSFPFFQSKESFEMAKAWWEIRVSERFVCLMYGGRGEKFEDSRWPQPFKAQIRRVAFSTGILRNKWFNRCHASRSAPVIAGYTDWVVQLISPEGVADIGTLELSPIFPALKKLKPWCDSYCFLLRKIFRGTTFWNRARALLPNVQWTTQQCYAAIENLQEDRTIAWQRRASE